MSDSATTGHANITSPMIIYLRAFREEIYHNVKGSRRIRIRIHLTEGVVCVVLWFNPKCTHQKS